jgi:hypothetical protein
LFSHSLSANFAQANLGLPSSCFPLPSSWDFRQSPLWLAPFLFSCFWDRVLNLWSSYLNFLCAEILGVWHHAQLCLWFLPITRHLGGLQLSPVSQDTNLLPL